MFRALMLMKPLVERFPRWSMFYRSIRDNTFMFEDPRPTPMGFLFIGNLAMETGAFEQQETEIVRRLMTSIDVFINVGANIGYYCCIALKEGKQVIAFEPIDHNLNYLYKNIESNGWSRDIEIFPIALGSSIGLAEIYGAKTGASLLKGWAGISESYKRFVPTSTLDTLLCDRLKGKQCFFLVDIEGGEHMMLRGASRHLALEPKPIWMMEIAIADHQPGGSKINPNLLATFAEFTSRGYQAFTADSRLKPITMNEISQIIDTGIDTIKTHNFLFFDANCAFDAALTGALSALTET